nr:hypothetical protein [Tanacetum cinerariifolium]
MKEKPSKPTSSKKIHKGKVMKVRKGKRSDHLIHKEDEEPKPAPEILVDDDEYNLQSGITQLPVLEGIGKGITTDELDGKIPESRPPPKHILMEEDKAGSNPGQSHVVLAGPNPEPMHEDFVATVYPKVHESLKHTTEEHVLKNTTEDHVHIENPLSSPKTLSSMKSLDDAFTFGGQFLNDKPTVEEPGKANVETEVESMVIVPIHQAYSSAPPLSTPIIDLTPPKLVSPPAQEPIFTATTASTTMITTLPLPPPPP